MKIKDVMRRNFVSVRCDASLIEVGRELVRSGGAAAVLDDGARLIGIVSEADLLPSDAAVRGPGRAARLLRAVLTGPDPDWSSWSSRLRAADVMKPPPTPVQEDDDPIEIGRAMLESHFAHVPVMRGTILVGILGRSELLRLLRSSDLTLQRAIERLLWRCGFTPPEHSIDVAINDGVVLVEGEVEHESDVHVVGSLIAGLDGVSAVTNHLNARTRRAHAPA